jgi:ferredoxin-NADP reductase
MRFFIIISTIIILHVEGYPWGTDECGPPNHGGGSSSDTSPFSIALNGDTLVVSSTQQFRGFFFTTNKGLSFSNIPVSSHTSDVCGDSDSALMQSNAMKRSMLTTTLSCSSNPGVSFTLTGYIVFSYRQAYRVISESFTCPSNDPETTLNPADTTASPYEPIPTSGEMAQFQSLSMLTVQWVPSTAAARSSTYSLSSSALTVYFDTSGNSEGWIGLGFGYADYRMSGGKKALSIEVSDGFCVMRFWTLVDHTAQSVTGPDPWLINPSCSMLTPTLASAEFTVGGSSLINLPPQGTKIYTLIAGALGTSFGDHGSTWDYKHVDYLSSVSPDTLSLSVNPWYLAHGIVFIANFSILMPLTSFLILYNKTRFYNTHKFLGVLIVLLLASGWLLTRGTNQFDSSTTYQPFSSDPNGENHESLGNIGCWTAVGVCCGGVVLWWIRLPKTMKKMVRYAHGIVGVGLSFFGPYVVWTGWVRLEPLIPPVSVLTDSAWIWEALAIALGGIYLLRSFFRCACGSGSNQQAEKESAIGESIVSRQQVQKLVDNGKLILIINGVVVEVPKNFSHPGGREVMAQFNGQEIGQVLSGQQPAYVKGKLKYVPHSDEAFMVANRMKIGVLEGAQVYLASPVVQLGDSIAQPQAADNYETLGGIISIDRINRADDYPVRLFRIGVQYLRDLGAVQVGSRIYLSIPHEVPAGEEIIKRPYTVCHVEANHVDFAIKIYPTGKFTQKLNWLKPGDAITLSKAISHPPIPCIPTPPSMLVFVAGGTGMVPMIGYFKMLSQFALGGTLLWWVRNELDLFLIQELQEFMKTVYLNVVLFYTQPVEAAEPIAMGQALKKRVPRRRSSATQLEANAFTGKISRDTILQAFQGSLPVDPHDLCFIMSGPEGFITTARNSITELGVPESRILSLD